MDNNNPNGAPWWKPAVALMGDVSTWIIVPIILALVIGKWLDKHYGTDQKWFLICAGIGFLITIVGIVKVIRGYMKDLKNIDQENQQNKK